MFTPFEEVEYALDILGLPKLITRSDIQKQYHFMAKKYHPDLGGDAEKMEQINTAYQVLMQYIEEFRYTFDKEEVSRQFPGAEHAQRFKP